MPEGTRLIIILEPKGEGTDASGQPIISFDRHECYARRIDRGGTFGVSADVQQGEWSARFDVRKDALAVRPRPGWQLVDDYGDQFEIKAVTEPPGVSPRHWMVYGTARSGAGA